MFKIRICSYGIFTLVVTAEIAVRFCGLVDFPIYNVDTEIGYIPKDNQDGKFLNRNDWYFNNRSMPTKLNWQADTGSENILLIGNSIIMGGNVFRQQDKLTQLIREHFGDHVFVWPVAVGGWSNVNEMVYLDRNPEVVATANYVAWEYMSGGLSRVTPWPSEYTFPTHKPIFAAWYVMRRYLVPRLFPFLQASELPVTGQITPQNVVNFDDELGRLTQAIKRHHAGFIWLYPKEDELAEARQGKEWLPERQKIQEIADKHGLRIVDIAAMPEWKSSLYCADRVHPTLEGNKTLAAILSREIAFDQQ